LLFQLVQRLARGRVADLVLIDDFVLGRHRRTGGQFAALNHADDVAADLKVFRRSVRFGGHIGVPVGEGKGQAWVFVKNPSLRRPGNFGREHDGIRCFSWTSIPFRIEKINGVAKLRLFRVWQMSIGVEHLRIREWFHFSR
jgi:hypothetical protein